MQVQGMQSGVRRESEALKTEHILTGLAATALAAFVVTLALRLSHRLQSNVPVVMPALAMALFGGMRGSCIPRHIRVAPPTGAAAAAAGGASTAAASETGASAEAAGASTAAASEAGGAAARGGAGDGSVASAAVAAALLASGEGATRGDGPRARTRSAEAPIGNAARTASEADRGAAGTRTRSASDTDRDGSVRAPLTTGGSGSASSSPEDGAAGSAGTAGGDGATDGARPGPAVSDASTVELPAVISSGSGSAAASAVAPVTITVTSAAPASGALIPPRIQPALPLSAGVGSAPASPDDQLGRSGGWERIAAPVKVAAPGAGALPRVRVVAMD